MSVVRTGVNLGAGRFLGQQMTLQDAFVLFRRLGVDPQALSRSEFSAAYHRLARRYHPDLNAKGYELMANINAARSLIMRSHRPD